MKSAWCYYDRVNIKPKTFEFEDSCWTHNHQTEKSSVW